MNAQGQAAISKCVLAFAVSVVIASPALAQDTLRGVAMQGMSMPEPKPEQHEHAARRKPLGSTAPASAGSTAAAHAMRGMDMSSMQGGEPPDARSPDDSDGYGYGPMTGMDMHDDPATGMLLLDRLEYAHPRDGGNAVAIEGQAWYGRNFNKLWLKFEGERSDGRLQGLRAEALWDHAVAAYWDAQLGIRHDFGGGPGRTWAAFGVEGLAPYWFETQATFYVGQGGRTAARLQFEYEMRLTQRLILQPELEANFYSQDDLQRGIGSGLSDAALGLRLRYEFTRRFAPYIGVEFERRLGETAVLARSRGERAFDSRLVAGVRVWF